MAGQCDHNCLFMHKSTCPAITKLLNLNSFSVNRGIRSRRSLGRTFATECQQAFGFQPIRNQITLQPIKACLRNCIVKRDAVVGVEMIRRQTSPKHHVSTLQ